MFYVENKEAALEDKVLKYVDQLTGRPSGMVKNAHPSASMTNNSYRNYRSSFLTLADFEIPNDYRDIFKWCRWFFKFDPLVGAAVRSMATFPITDYVLNDTTESDEIDVESDNEESEEASETYKFYDNVLKEMDLYNHLIEVGYDYFLYGNCIIFAEPGLKTIKRRDKETGEIYEKKEVVWKSIQRLDVTRLRLDRDPETNETIFYYDIPAHMKTIIRTKKPKHLYDKIPKIFKKAVDSKSWVRLKSEYVHPLQMPSESGDEGLWATPPVLHVMKLLLYTNVLRQAQEAIAREHIVPKRVYFFQDTVENAASLDFEQLAADFSVELKRQIDDPNYQIVSPFPINQIMHGGQGKALMLVPEIEQLTETILAGMNCPKEFIFGGVSYTGSTTSLRILENHFITYRTKLADYVNNFLIKRLAELRGEWETIDDDEKLVTVTFSDLKMQDDIQQKQLMIQMNQQGKLPDETLYEDVLGLDSTKMVKLLESERMRKLQEQEDLTIAQMESQARVQGKQMELGMMPGDPSQMPVDPSQTANAPMVPEPAPGAFQPQGGEETAEEGNTGEAPPTEAPAQGEESGQPNEREIEQIAMEMKNMTEAEQAQVISRLDSKTSQRVMMYLTQWQQNEEQEIDMRPMPEKLPPRRPGGV